MTFRPQVLGVPIILLLYLSLPCLLFAESVKTDNAACLNVYREALALVQNGQCRRAIGVFNNADNVCPPTGVVPHALSICYEQMGDREKALREIKRAVSMAPGNNDYRVWLGTLYIQQKEWDQAIDQLNLLWDRDRTLATGLANQLVIARHMPNRSVDVASEGTTLSYGMKIDNPVLMKQLESGNAALKEGNYLKTKEHFEEAIKIDQHCVLAYIFLVKTYQSLGKIEPAIQVLESGVERNPKDPLLLLNLGLHYYDYRSKPEANVVWQRLKAIDPIAYKTVQRFAVDR